MGALNEGLEPQLGQLADEVREAEKALLAKLEEEPNREWNPRELQDAARTNGWSSSVVSIAFWRLVSSERLRVDEHLRVRSMASGLA